MLIKQDDLSKWAHQWLGALFIAGVAVAGLIWTWGTWPDILMDFGRELYIPWQLAEGKVLYTDIAYFNGPLSPYLNSLWFRLFGVSLMTLVICNAVITAILIVLLYRLLLYIGNRLSAIAACVTFAAVFAVGNLLPPGNYTYICPYSHEMTHGIVLALAAIWCMSMYHRSGRLVYVAGVGLFLGLVFLTKAEIFLAAAAAVVAALVLTIWSQHPHREHLIKLLGIFTGSVFLPVAVAFGLLCMVMPANEALCAITGTWRWIGKGEVTSLLFYRRMMGLNQPLINLKQILLWTGWYAAVFVPAGLLAMILRSKGRYCTVAVVAGFVITVVLLGFQSVRDPLLWFDAAWPLPLLMLVLAVGSFVVFSRHRGNIHLQSRLILQLCMILFALGLLGKMILCARVYHYGFVLAMPAVLVTAVMLVCWIPNWLDRRGGCGSVFKAVGLGILLVFILAHLWAMSYFLGGKTYEVSNGTDTILTDKREEFVNILLDFLAQQLKPGQTLAVLPEGVMINYLSRRINPTPYINFLPPELIMFGEDKMLASFRECPPDWIVLIHRDSSEYGTEFFGRDYGKLLGQWITSNYEIVRVIGDMPFTGKYFGISITKRRAFPDAGSGS